MKHIDNDAISMAQEKLSVTDKDTTLAVSTFSYDRRRACERHRESLAEKILMNEQRLDGERFQ